MFKIEYDVIDEFSYGDTKLRLVESIRTKRRVVQVYHSIGNHWSVMHRINANEKFEEWKALGEYKETETQE